MDLFARLTRLGHEQVVFWQDEASGLRAIVAIHNTTLGPALGGTRMYPYATEAEALDDVLRLARAMTYKSAAAGLDLGGGKAVIIGDPHQKSEQLLRAYGRCVESLGGRYITTTDVGTRTEDLDIIARETRYVVGRPPASGGSGDTSILTGKTVFLGMRAAAQVALGVQTLRGLSVAIQGAGKVGWHVMEHLATEGATLIVSDIDAEQARRAAQHFGARLVGVESIYDVECDIFSPNALGGVLNARTIPRLRCRIVCGGANNQLETPEDADRLAERGILYAPDFVVNCGGVINVAEELAGYNAERAAARAAAVFDTTLRILAMAERMKVNPAVAAERYAEERIAAIAALHRSYIPGSPR